jgi:rare lipoprotein A
MGFHQLLFPVAVACTLLLQFPASAASLASGDHPTSAAATDDDDDPAYEEIGTASWYGAFHQGRRTASGKRFDMHKLTAAHPSLPLDTRLKVTNLANGRTVEVIVNDRGPYVRKRIIDLSARAAERIGLKQQGIGRVKIEVVNDEDAG